MISKFETYYSCFTFSMHLVSQLQMIEICQFLKKQTTFYLLFCLETNDYSFVTCKLN